MKKSIIYRLAWPSTIAIGILYALLIVFIMNPRSFIVNDQGVKFLQVYNLNHNGWSSIVVDYPGQELDPDNQFSPLLGTPFFYEKDGQTFGIYSLLFIALVAPFYSILGYHGLYVIPILGTVGAMWIGYLMSKRFSERFAPLAPLMIGLATPLFYFSLDIWEGPITVFLIMLSVLLILQSLDDVNRQRLFFAGLTLGAAVWIREELYMMIPAVGLVLLISRSTRRLPPLFAFGVGLGIPILLLWLFWFIQSGNILGTHVGLAVAADNPAVSSVRFGSLNMLAPLQSERWIGLLALVIIGRLVLMFARGQLQTIIIFTYAAAIILFASYNMYKDYGNLTALWRPEDILRSFPLILFVAFSGLGTTNSDNSQKRDARMICLIIVVFMACILPVTRLTGGPSQWGARFLLPVYGLLVVLIIHVTERTITRGYLKTPIGIASSAVFIVLLFWSAFIEFRGVQYLQDYKLQYERLILTTQDIIQESGTDYIVSDVWWFAHMQASIFYDKTFFLVEYHQNKPIEALTDQLRNEGVESFLYVTSPDEPDTKETNHNPPGWKAEETYSEQIWERIDFTVYEAEE